MDKRHICIRPIESNDIDRVMELEKICFSTPWSREAFQIEVEQNRFASYFVVESRGHIVGYGGMWHIIGEVHITNIAIHPDFRRKGIGRELMLFLMESALSHGAKKMTLEVRKSNIGAKSLYRGLDFIEKGIRKGYYGDTGEDAIIMWNEDIEYTVTKHR